MRLDPEYVRSVLNGRGEEWGEHGDADNHRRYAKPMSNRRRCSCGCETGITHVGMANGVALMNGCALSVYRWVDAR